MLENAIFCMNFIIFYTQNRKALADYRMRIPFQMHPTSPRPGAGILPQATEIAILLGTCRKSRKIAGSEIDSIFHWFWTLFWTHCPTILALIFDPFSASISVACGNSSAPGPREVRLHLMVCAVEWFAKQHKNRKSNRNYVKIQVRTTFLSKIHKNMKKVTRR